MGDAPTPVGPRDWVDERLAEIDHMGAVFGKVKTLVELAELLLSRP